MFSPRGMALQQFNEELKKFKAVNPHLSHRDAQQQLKLLRRGYQIPQQGGMDHKQESARVGTKSRRNVPQPTPIDRRYQTRPNRYEFTRGNVPPLVINDFGARRFSFPNRKPEIDPFAIFYRDQLRNPSVDISQVPDEDLYVFIGRMWLNLSPEQREDYETRAKNYPSTNTPTYGKV